MIAPHSVAFEILDDGAILLDLRAGTLFRLNRTAAFVWGRVLAGASALEAARQLAAAFGVSEERAQADVATLLALPSSSPQPSDPPRWPFKYEQVESGYVLSLDETPVVAVESANMTLRRLEGFRDTDASVIVRTVAPKLAALRGATVLHASAVARDRRGVVAFAGSSGAGKTTTARVFGRAGRDRGWSVICEDKLVLRLERGLLLAVRGAERRILDWIQMATRQLTSGSASPVETASLVGLQEGDGEPVEEVVFLDAERRAGARMQLEAVPSSRAAEAIFHHAFHGSATLADWRRQVAATATLARGARAFEATMPLGLEALEAEAQRYTDTMAS